MNENNDVKKYLLSDKSFEMLRNAQQRINEATGFMPSLRKLINELVYKKSVDDLITTFIDKLTMGDVR